MLKKYIIAGNYQEYLRWLSDTGNNSKDYKYITREQDIAGIHDPDRIIFVSKYYLNPLFDAGIPVVEKAKNYMETRR